MLTELKCGCILYNGVKHQYCGKHATQELEKPNPNMCKGCWIVKKLVDGKFCNRCDIANKRFKRLIEERARL